MPDAGVLVLYNLPSHEHAFRAACGASDDGVMHAVKHVADALADSGIPARVAGVRRLTDLPAALAAGSEPVVFNLVERLDGGPHDVNAVPAVCRALGRACTGGDMANLCLTLDKALAKARLAAHGVPVAPGLVIPTGAPIPDTLPADPWIVKPLCAGGSEGIQPASLVRDRTHLEPAVARIHSQFEQDALVETFIEGREFNLAVIERQGAPWPLPVAEIDFSLFPPNRPHLVDYDVKWQPGTIAGQVSPRRVPADIPPDLTARLHDLACRAWHACGCSDYIRVDTRMDAAGSIYVLEVNANCDLCPLAGLPAALAAAGIPFPTFVLDMVANARNRTSIPAC
jgi:D-alanine-D-alanine ligase